MSDITTPVYSVLFICQENAGRSLMAQSMLNKMGHGRFEAFSAGIAPADEPNPIAMQILQAEGYDTTHLKPKHYSVFLEEDAPPLDFVFTLCSDSEQEAKVSIWNELSTDTITAHWHFSDPQQLDVNSETADTDAEMQEYHNYSHVQRELAQRIRLFMNLPEDKLDKLAHHHPLVEDEGSHPSL